MNNDLFEKIFLNIFVSSFISLFLYIFAAIFVFLSDGIILHKLEYAILFLIAYFVVSFGTIWGLWIKK